MTELLDFSTNAIESDVSIHELTLFDFIPNDTFIWNFEDLDPIDYARNVWEDYVRSHVSNPTIFSEKIEITRNIYQLSNSSPVSYLLVENKVIVDMVKTACYLQYLSGVTSFAVIAERHYDVMPELLLAVCINISMNGKGTRPYVFDLVSSFAAHHHHDILKFNYRPPYEQVDLRFLHCIKPEMRLLYSAQALTNKRLNRTNHSERVNDQNYIKVGQANPVLVFFCFFLFFPLITPKLPTGSQAKHQLRRRPQLDTSDQNSTRLLLSILVRPSLVTYDELAPEQCFIFSLLSLKVRRRVPV